MTTGCTAIIIDITDDEGKAIGRSIPVSICYAVTKDSAYGADADGNRGELRIEVEILDHHIDQAHTMTMTSDQVEQVLRDADAIILRKLETV